MDTLSGIAANPNVYGTILIGNGCEVIQAADLEKEIRNKTSKPLECFIIREEGGSLKTVEKAAAAAEKMVKEAEKQKRVLADAAELILGTECGGSDPTSGLAANPVVGICGDSLTALGGTVILSETPEMIGAEHLLAKRCRTKELGDSFLP